MRSKKNVLCGSECLGESVKQNRTSILINTEEGRRKIHLCKDYYFLENTQGKRYEKDLFDQSLKGYDFKKQLQ